MIIGIDLGTTNSLVSYFKDGESILIPNEHGDYMTPSVVSISDQNEIIVGKMAKERQLSHPDQAVSLFKRTMGTYRNYILGNKKYLSEELSAYILRSLKEDAERYLGEEVQEAVISVPAYFDEDGRSATKKAGELAGLKVERIINEPSAAALACRMEERKKVDNEESIDDQVYMIFDFGGGTLDVSLVECFENVIGITAVSGNNQLGGSDIDLEIAKEFCLQNGISLELLDEHTKNILLKQAEINKCLLSDKEQTVMRVMINGQEKILEMTNDRLIKICKDILQEVWKPVETVLQDSFFSMEEIDKIILIGGSSKMPSISRFLKMKTGKTPVIIGSPDTMVALGLGIYAGMKERQEEIKDLVMTDICPFSLGVNIHNPQNQNNELMSVVIPRNTELPCTKKGSYQPLTLQQRELTFRIYQGEDKYVENNICLGELRVPLLPPQNNQDTRPVELSMTYDINGLLNIEATILRTGKKCETYIVRDHYLSKKEIHAKKCELEKYKTTQKEDEQDKYLRQRAENLFCILTGSLRNYHQMYFSQYINIMKNGTPLQKKRAIQRFENIMDQMEKEMCNYEIKVDDLKSEEMWDELLGDSAD